MGCVGSAAGAAQPEVQVMPVEDFHRQYALGRELGRGTFGRVLVVQPQAGVPDTDERAIPLAVKVVLASETERRSNSKNSVRSKQSSGAPVPAAWREGQIWRLLGKHQNIVQLHSVFVSIEVSYMVMERCDHGTLADWLRAATAAAVAMPECIGESKAVTVRGARRGGPAPAAAVALLGSESRVAFVVREMLRAIAHVHGRGVVHRDIKPSNFLIVAEGNQIKGLKLADFGTATAAPAPSKTLLGCYGTAPYMSPEMVGGQGHTQTTDIWSVGVIAYELIFGCYPYMPEKPTLQAMKQAISTGVPAPPFHRDVRSGFGSLFAGQPSDSAVDFARAMLQRSAGERCSVAVALSSPFVLAANIAGLEVGEKVEAPEPAFNSSESTEHPSSGASSLGSLGDSGRRDMVEQPRLLGNAKTRSVAQSRTGGPGKVDGGGIALTRAANPVSVSV